jgi:SpoVK/Ycf46/Vps4 family AAA+-type ATPase
LTNAKSEKQTGHSQVSWERANWSYLQIELERLRLILQRRIIWLRANWKHDPLQQYQGMVISDTHVDWLLSAKDLKAEERFYNEDKSCSQITLSITNLEKKCKEFKQAMLRTGQSPALTVLSDIFGLSAFETDTLLLCLAPELDPAFERLYAYIQDDLTKKYATPHLALTLFERPDMHFGFTCFLPNAPLRYFRMVVLETTQQQGCVTFAHPLSIDEQTCHYICGKSYISEQVQEVLHSASSIIPPLVNNHKITDTIEQQVHSILRNGKLPCINLIGLPDNGQKSLAGELCKNLGYQLLEINIDKIPADLVKQKELIRLLEREALLLRFAYYINISDTDSEKDNVKILNNIIENIYTLIIIDSKDRWQTRRESLTVHVPEINSPERKNIWQSALSTISAAGSENILEEIVQQFEFGPEAIASVITSAKMQAKKPAKSNKHQITDEQLWNLCSDYTAGSMDELARQITTSYTWDDIVLPADIKKQLQELSNQVMNRSTVYDKWGFSKYLIRGKGITALFSGQSGTGKTMAAEILSNQGNSDSTRVFKLYRIDLASIVSKFIGETEKNLKKVFDVAERSGVILFFDEADALFGKRTEIKDSHDRYANLEINYLLQRMEDYKGLAILATNNKNYLDNAFTRRLRFIIDFPFPDTTIRKQIWQKIFPEKVPLNGIDYDALARLEISGGSIKNIAVNTAFLAAGVNKPVSMPLIMHAARREYAKINKMISESEFGKYYQLIKL